MSDEPTASYDAPPPAGKIAAPVGSPPTDDPRFDVDLVMDRALAANEMARDAAIVKARQDAERAAALVIAATGTRLPVGTGAEDYMVNPIVVARALSKLGLLHTPPVEPVSVIAAELAEVAARRGAVITDAAARIVTRAPGADVLGEVYDILTGLAMGPVLPDATVALMTAPLTDDKAHIRDRLDLVHAEWVRADAEGVDQADCVSYAFVTHTDGVTYTAMRKGDGGVVLVFTPAEWDAFVKGARDGEFTPPTD